MVNPIPRDGRNPVAKVKLVASVATLSVFPNFMAKFLIISPAARLVLLRKPNILDQMEKELASSRDFSPVLTYILREEFLILDRIKLSDKAQFLGLMQDSPADQLVYMEMLGHIKTTPSRRMLDMVAGSYGMNVRINATLTKIQERNLIAVFCSNCDRLNKWEQLGIKHIWVFAGKNAGVEISTRGTEKILNISVKLLEDRELLDTALDQIALL